MPQPKPSPMLCPDDSLRWHLWWSIGFTPIVRLIDRLPIAEWRKDQWVWRIDIWAMDHIGRATR